MTNEVLDGAHEIADGLGRINDLPGTPYRAPGGSGGNRALHRVNQLGLDDDLQAVAAWLREYLDQVNTHRAYLREAERLLLWCRHQGTTLSQLSRADLERYHAFLLDPRPRAQWCGRRVARFQADGSVNPRWRPFVAPLDEGSARQALRVLNSLLSYLVEAGYLDGNPLALIKGARRAGSGEQRAARADKTMSGNMVLAIWSAIDRMPAASTQERRSRARARWLVMCGFYLGARISELAEHTMGSFRRRNDPDGRGRWWWYAQGKGGKLGTVPVPDAFVEELCAYREAIGQPPLPEPNEATPIIGTIDGQRSVTARRLRQVFEGIIWAAADELECTSPHEAAVLRRATPHWMRHSYITQLLEDGRDLTLACENARHDSVETTMIYVHRNDRQRHEATRDLQWASSSEGLDRDSGPRGPAPDETES